jgi:hypothetical protein
MSEKYYNTRNRPLLERRQFQIRYEPVTESREIVDKIFIAAAKKFKLFDNTVTSLAPNTIKSIVEKQWFGFGFGARVVGELIVIDFFPNKSPSTALYSDISDYLREELINVFREQMREVYGTDVIPTH